MALIMLRETGSCEFSVPEYLFGMDFPGHYLRRLKSVSVTVPCIVGPYTSIDCTLRMLSHKYRISPTLKPSYTEDKSRSEDLCFSSTNVPITAVAILSAQEDSGVFELNFSDERYIPFEGAGAISSWRLELPAPLRQFPYETISDVIVHSKYTSLEGGQALREAAGTSVLKKVEGLDGSSGLHALLDIRNDFSTDWVALNAENEKGKTRITSMPNMEDRLPTFTRGRTAKVEEMSVISDTPLPAPVKIENIELEKSGKSGEDARYFVSEADMANRPLNIRGNWTLTIGDRKMDSSRVWLLVQYTLSKPQP